MTRPPLSAPENLRGAVFDEVTLVVDYRGGDVLALTGQISRTWRQAAAVGTEDRSAVHEELAARGLLVQGARPRPLARGKAWELSFGAEEFDAGLTDIPEAPAWRLRCHTILALTLTVAVRWAGPRAEGMKRMLRLLECAHRATRQHADPEDAHAAVQSIRRAARWLPVRVACLEESVAAVLALALSRQAVTWCHGIANDPYTLHAWIMCNGEPVAEPASTSRYTILRTIPDVDRGHA